MTLPDLIDRRCPPEPWTEGEGLPWNDPDFSERMLAEHLSQDHDWASRRDEIIDRQVAWLREAVLPGRPCRILDLGCGPGLYLQRLAALGHDCQGIDFSPASIAHAREAAKRDGLEIRYRQEDLRSADLGAGFDLVMMIWGEFNVFSPAAAIDLLRRAHSALGEEGRLLLEINRFDTIRALGRSASVWTTAASGLFGAAPYLRLEESFWDEECRAATHRFHIVDMASSRKSTYSISYQAYEDAELRRLLASAGFKGVTHHESLTGAVDVDASDLAVYVGEKQGPG